MPDTSHDPRAPMASAPMKYLPDGSVDWGDMWDSFCVLARDGGPPHRPSRLDPGDAPDATCPAYRRVVAEIIRGVESVSGLKARAAEPGWIAIECYSAEMAAWLCESIERENVAARAEEARLFVPAGEHFTLTAEIKNVITAVAKTTHYWHEHLPPEVRRALAAEAQIRRLGGRLIGWFRGYGWQA
jgi:sirohydrochlorin cobaltochelatase